MSNEIRASATLTITDGGLSYSGTSTATLDLTGSVAVQQVQSVGTSYEQVDYGDMTSCKAVWLYNNSTGSVTCSFNLAGTQPFCTLYPLSDKRGLSFALFTPLETSRSVFLKADLPSTLVQIVTTEN